MWEIAGLLWHIMIYECKEVKESRCNGDVESSMESIVDESLALG